MQVEATAFCINIESYIIAIGAVGVQGNADTSIEGSPKYDYERVIVKVGRIVNDV